MTLFRSPFERAAGLIVGIIVLLGATIFGVLAYRDRSVNVGRNEFLPLGSDLELMSETELVLSGGGPEVHVLYLVIASKKTRNEAELIEAFKNHLESKGFEMRTTNGDWWAYEGVNANDTVVAVGSLVNYLQGAADDPLEGLVPRRLRSATTDKDGPFALAAFEPARP